MTEIQSKTRLEMVAATGRFFQLLGLPRSTGQVYGLLYLSDVPLSLSVMAAKTSLSKGSVSIATRHLVSWGAARNVWVQGSRQDHFEAVGELSTVLEQVYRERVRSRINTSRQRVEAILKMVEEDEAEGHLASSEAEFCRKRVRTIESLHSEFRSISPLVESFLKLKPTEPED